MSALLDTIDTITDSPAAVVSIDLTVAATRYRQLQERMKSLQAEVTAARGDLQAQLEALRCEQIRAGEAPTATKVETLQGVPLTVVWQERYCNLPPNVVKSAKAGGAPIAAVQSIRLRRGLTLQGLRERLGQEVLDLILPLLVVNLDHNLPKGSAEAAARAFLNGDLATGETLLELIMMTSVQPVVRT